MEAPVSLDAEMIRDDVPDSIVLLQNICDKSEEVRKHVLNITERVQGDVGTHSKQGLDFLDVKCGVLVSYLADLCHVLLLKVSGKGIHDEESLHRLVENRTVLEKMKPIDDRLKYQISKFVQAAITGKADENDPLRLKPNPANLVSKVGEESDDEDNEDSGEDIGEEKKTKVYVPPKLAPAHYDGDLSVEGRKEMHLERAKRRALNTGLMRELQAEYSEAPTEIVDAVDTSRTKAHKMIQDKTEFEEERFVRLADTKKDKHAQKSVNAMTSLDTLTHFRDVSALQNDDLLEKMSSKKRKSGGSNKGSSKKKKKRKFKH